MEFDPDEDILWVGRRCTCLGDECIHAAGEVFRPTPGIAVTVAEAPDGKRTVTSIALLKVSSHPAWASLFAALQWGVMSGRPVKLSTMIDWFTPEAFLREFRGESE